MIHISRSTENPGFFLPTFPRKPKTSKAWTPAFWSTWLGVTPQHTWPPARALVGLKIDAPNSNGWSSFSLVACGYLMVPLLTQRLIFQSSWSLSPRFLVFLKKDVVPLYSTWFPTSFFSLKGCHCAEFCHLGNGPIARPLGWNHRAIGPRLFSHRTWPLPNWRT